MSWQAKPLGEICSVIGGGTPSKSRAEYYEGDIPWASIRDMQGDWIESTELSITDKAVASSATNVIPSGNVIVATRVGLGKVARLRRDTAINQDIRAVIPHDERELDKQYLFYWFKSIAKNIEAEGKGATVKGVTLPFVTSLQLPLPPRQEQHRIVAILDEAFAGIAAAETNTERNLKNTRLALKSHRDSVFSKRGKSWREFRIEDWCESIMDCVNKTAPTVERETPFKMVRTTNVRHGRVDLDSVKFVSEATYNTWTRRQVPKKKDVILTREAPMGEVGILLTDDKVFLGQRLVSYRADARVLDSDFLCFALQSSRIQEQIHAKASGSTVQHMRVPDTKNLILSAPPIHQQREIVAELGFVREEIQRLESLTTRKLALLNELKQSLLQQAFLGQI
jgi:type I restriction enzyme S subunit